MDSEFTRQVEVKIESIAAEIAAGRHEDGWALGPDRIVAEMADEPVDVCGWDRGLDLYPEPPGAGELRATIRQDARLLWEAIGRLRAMYG